MRALVLYPMNALANDQAKRLADPVNLLGIDVLQVQLGQRLVNTNRPRATFAT